jgi:hypothetical protein
MNRLLAAILLVLSGCAVAPGTEVPTPDLGAADPPPRTGSATDPVCGMKLDDTTPWRAEVGESSTSSTPGTAARSS